MSNRRAGVCYFKIDGKQYDVKGGFTYGLGTAKKESIVGHDGVHGYKALPQAPFIEGEITDHYDLDLQELLDFDGVTITLELANGKTIMLRDAWCVSEGQGSSEEANISLRFEGLSAEEIK